jgi:hypothetical protein
LKDNEKTMEKKTENRNMKKTQNASIMFLGKPPIVLAAKLPKRYYIPLCTVYTYARCVLNRIGP